MRLPISALRKYRLGKPGDGEWIFHPRPRDPKYGFERSGALTCRHKFLALRHTLYFQALDCVDYASVCLHCLAVLGDQMPLRVLEKDFIPYSKYEARCF